MNDQIKPIDTIFKGNRFRSRLEARWAVFFDELRIKYDYEPEGYALAEHGNYLPDFWLPEFKLWVEVKPNSPENLPVHKKTKAHEKAMALMRMTSYPVLLCIGQPKTDWNYLYICDTTDSGGGYGEFYATFGGINKPLILIHDERADISFHTTDWEPLERFKNLITAGNDYHGGPEDIDNMEFCQILPKGDTPSYKAALKAKQARFEFGQNST